MKPRYEKPRLPRDTCNRIWNRGFVWGPPNSHAFFMYINIWTLVCVYPFFLRFIHYKFVIFWCLLMSEYSMRSLGVPNRVICVQECLLANMWNLSLKFHIFVIKYPILEMLFGTSLSHPWVCSAWITVWEVGVLFVLPSTLKLWSKLALRCLTL